MNVHTLLDEYTVLMSSLVTSGNTYFSESVASPTVSEMLNEIDLQLPALTGTGVYDIDAGTPVGLLDPAVYVPQWYGDGHPTLIYHHGNNERPFDFGMFSKNTFKTIILNAREHFPANLLVVRAPFHQSLNTYVEKIVDLKNFSTMLATSVQLIESLQMHCRNQGSSAVIVSGISLGGWVTNMHRSFFNSADMYLPMMAGAALDHVFLLSAYRRLTGQCALENAQQVRHVLNFESGFSSVGTDNVFPLLARHDAIIDYERQKHVYDDREMRVIERGHVTGLLSTGQLRQFLLEQLNRVAPDRISTEIPTLLQQ